MNIFHAIPVIFWQTTYFFHVYYNVVFSLHSQSKINNLIAYKQTFSTEN